MDIQMPEMNGLDALIAIRTEFPDARIIVLTTYEGDIHSARHEGWRSGLPAQEHAPFGVAAHDPSSACRKEKSVARGLIPVAQHVSDQALTPAEVVVLRLIAAGNANKQIADQLAITEDTVRGSQEHSFETGRQRPDACSDHRPKRGIIEL